MLDSKKKKSSAARAKVDNKEKSYLDLLKFDKKYLKTFGGKYLKNLRLMVILTLTITLVGFFSFFTLPKSLYPKVKIPIITVATVMPGAGPKDVESLITLPIENKIKSIKGVEKYSSSSQDSVSIISAEFSSNTDPTEARNEVQSAVDRVNNLPEDATTPEVNEMDFENIPIIQFVLTKKNNQNDSASLNRISTRLKNGLEELNSIDRVETSGLDEREIQILIKQEIIEAHKVSPFELSNAIRTTLQSYPAGEVISDNSTFSLSIDQPINSLDELRNLNITFDDEKYMLSDLAIIKESSKYNQSSSYLTSEGKKITKVAYFTLYKTSSADIEKTGEEARKYIQNFISDHKENYEIKIMTDFAESIDDQFVDLWDNFVQTLLLVFLSMLLLYGVRQASIASAAIPLALLVVFIVMQFAGISLNFISIFSLLIALGLFVDNAVVVIEGYTSYYRTGKFTPLETAILVWKDFFVELFSINLLTVWSFLPLLITEGMIGEFIYPIPIIVATSMMGSMAVAMMFTLPAMMILTKFKLPRRVRIMFKVLAVGLLFLTLFFMLPATSELPASIKNFTSSLSLGQGVDWKSLAKIIIFFAYLGFLIVFLRLLFRLREELATRFKSSVKQFPELKKAIIFFRRSFDKGFISLDSLSNSYQKLLRRILASKRIRVQIIISIIVFTVGSYLLLPLGLVESTFFPKTNQDEIYVELELPAGTNKKVTDRYTIQLLERLKNTQDADFIVAETGRSQANRATVALMLKDEDDRQKTSIQIAQELRNNLVDFQFGKISVVEESGGPPAGSDLEINIFGDDLNKLGNYAEKVENFLKKLPGATNIDRSIKSGTSKIVFEPDSGKLKYHDIDEGTIGFWLRTYASGFTIDEWTIDDEDYDLVLKMNTSNITPEAISVLQIPVGKGRYVPLSDLGTLHLKTNPTIITREDGNRNIKVTAGAMAGYQSVELNKKLEKFASTELNLDSGYSWKVGGVNEENQKSNESIMKAMVISAILILGTMVVQLGSFRKAFIVMLVIPLATSGVFIIFALTGIPISFPSMVGMLSLFGIVIANSLMIVDKVNQNRSAGMKMHESIIDAASSRLEPIALTSVSQVIGLIPITLSDPLWQGMGGAIIAGMMFSGTIMLFFIPVVYYYLFPEK